MSGTPIILSIAFPFAPVGAAAVGGAEVLLSQIEAALPALGFRSVVVAHAASQPTGELYPVGVPDGEITDALRVAVETAVQTQIDRALAEHPVALVHMHGLDFARYRIPAGVPALVTLHLPPGWYPESIWSLPRNYTLVCVSETQRRACPEAWRERLAVIGNGVPLPDAALLRPNGRYALMLARICPEKNLHTGLDAARLAGLPAVLAGEVFGYGAHLRYFAGEIEPRLTQRGTGHASRPPEGTSEPIPRADARFLGPVTGAAKTRLLVRAACLLLPSLAPETSSLVAMEALAAGVPVVAMASGAVPEIVEEGRTGFLIPPGSGIEAAKAMADAIRRVPSLYRQTCREIAVERFGLDHTLANYGELYRKLARTPVTAPLDRKRVPVGGFSETANPVPSEVHTEVLAAEAALEALLPEWADLWSADPGATPFGHPSWLWPWWRQFGSEGKLHALVMRTGPGGELAAFLPLYVYTKPETLTRQLLPLGAGTSDYLQGVWRAGSPALAEAALAHLQHGAGAWDVAQLFQLRGGSPLVAAAQQRHMPLTDAEPTAILELADRLPAKLRANAGRYRRRAGQLGRLRLHVAVTETEALDGFEALLRFHGERWDGRGETGVLSDPRVQAHHRAALPKLLEAGLLRLFRLTLGERTLGVLYALADPPSRPVRSLYLYLIGFDTGHAELSPGTLLLHHVWEYGRAEGFARLDLLRGGEDYKRLWGARDERTYAMAWQRST